MNENNDKETIYSVAKRNYACVLALSSIMGFDPIVMLNERREICTAVFMQVSREGIKIKSDIKFPKLAQTILMNGRD